MDAGKVWFEFMTLSARSRLAEGDPCPSCPEGRKGELVSRPAHPYPVVTQVLFGLSFVLFLVFFDKIQMHKVWVWSWSAVQFGLGIVLVYRRRRASKRVLHCIRCGQELR
jgi:hypothetical protein